MERVSRQQFVRYTSKYLKNLPIVVTNRGEEDFVLQPWKDYCLCYPPDVQKSVQWSLEQDPKVWVNTYGCGECPKIEGQALCKKHDRI